MRTQGEDDAKTRFRISLTSSEKTDSQIYRLKENRPYSCHFFGVRVPWIIHLF